MKSKESQFICQGLQTGNGQRSWPAQLLVLQARDSGVQARADFTHDAGDLGFRRIHFGFSDLGAAIKEAAPAGFGGYAENLENARSRLHDVTSDPEKRIVGRRKSAPQFVIRESVERLKDE